MVHETDRKPNKKEKPAGVQPLTEVTSVKT